MKGLAPFFRIFDIAFLAPGILILVTLQATGASLSITPTGTTGALASIAQGIWLLTTACTLGLATHASTRLILQVTRKRRGANGGDRDACMKWYAPGSPFASGDGHTIAMYFWYLRATCWNLAVAVIVSGVMILLARCLGCLELPSHPLLGLAVGAPVVASLLTFLGNDFDRAFHEATVPPDTADPGVEPDTAPGTSTPADGSHPAAGNGEGRPETGGEPAPAPVGPWAVTSGLLALVAALGVLLGQNSRWGKR